MSPSDLARPCCWCLLATWLLAVGPGAVAEEIAAALPEGDPAVVEARIEDGLLTLQADGVPLAEVLRAIGEAGSFGVVLQGDLEAPGDVSFAARPLERALRQLVDRHTLIVKRAEPGAEKPAEIRVVENSNAAESQVDPGALDAVATTDPMAADPPSDRAAFREARRGLAPPTKAEILFELGAPDQASRVAAIPKLGALAPREAVEILSDVVTQDDDRLVRSRGVAALTRRDGPDARRLLRDRALADGDPQLRMQALNALASTSGERAVNLLGEALRADPAPEVRLTAIRALGRVGGAWARRALARAARDPDPAISAAAEKALAARRAKQ